LTLSARQIEAGNLELNLRVRSRDEVGKLADAFNSMASRLREFKRLDHDRLIRTKLTTQLAIDSLPDAVFVIGPDDAIEISNDAARKYFGIEPGKAVASLGLNWLPPLYETVKTQHRPVEPRGYQSAIQVFVNGEERFLLPRAVPMLSPDHRPLGVTAILVDVTQLRQVDEAKSNLVSTVSHELRTPLTSQRLLLGLLITSLGPTLPPKQKRMLEVAKADSDRLYRIIDDLLRISRIESGRVTFQFRPMSPLEIVQSSVEPLSQLFADKQLRLEISVSDDLPPVLADPVSIQSALTNLLSNGLKFTPSGGRVSVKAETHGDGIAFSVVDSGPGIPGEFRSRIFEKFFRVPVSSGISGAGLGLSITKNIVEGHGGHIEFECPEYGGTVFRFTIPFAEQSVHS
jgi:signal transduction histidine kinase